MAEDHARPAGGRKKTTGVGKKAGDGSKTAAPKGTKAHKATSAKPTAEGVEKARPVTKPRTRRKPAASEPTREAVAERAYLLWERGEVGDQTEHWLRAEAELRAA